MSLETNGIDARGYLSGWLSSLVNMYQADIRAIPADGWTATHGGCSASASQMTSDAIGMLQWATDSLNGNPDLPDGSYISDRIKGACATREGASEELAAVSRAFVAALAAASDESLNANIVPPWRMETPLFMIAQIAVSHLWYHDGQLNYIQTMQGDDKVHWMGD